jgi:hypothetical protein
MIYKKRDQWCFRDENGKLHKFLTEAEANLAFNGITVSESVLEEDFDEYFEEDVED